MSNQDLGEDKFETSLWKNQDLGLEPTPVCNIHNLPDAGLGEKVMSMLKPEARIILCASCRKRLKASLDDSIRRQSQH